MTRFDWGLSKGFHQAALILLDLWDPIGLTCGHQYMIAELLDVSVEWFCRVNLEFGREFRCAAGAVPTTIGAVLLGINRWEDVIGARVCSKKQRT